MREVSRGTAAGGLEARSSKCKKPPGAACKRAAFARTDRARKGSILLPGEFDDGLVELVGAVLGVVWGQLHAVDAVFGCALEALVDHREVVGADEGGACVVVGLQRGQVRSFQLPLLGVEFRCAIAAADLVLLHETAQPVAVGGTAVHVQALLPRCVAIQGLGGGEDRKSVV